MKMFACQGLSVNDSVFLTPSFTTFLLPAPLPKWPQGMLILHVNILSL